MTGLGKREEANYQTDNLVMLNEGMPAMAQFRTMISPTGGMQSSLVLVPMAGNLLPLRLVRINPLTINTLMT